MKQLASRVSCISPSLSIAITSQAKQMKIDGRDVVNLGAGEPDFDTPEHIKNAGIYAIRSGLTKYTFTAGSQDIVQAVADKFRKDNGLKYAQNQIVVSSGAKHSIFNALLALVNPGDEVIVPVPYWVTYPELVKFLGATPVFVQGVRENKFKITGAQLAAAITPKTKALILNSPNNPSGAVYGENELKDIAAVVVKKDLYCIADEVYEKIIYNNARHISIASLGPEIFEQTVTVNGVSKSFAMTGWRIGYLGAPEPIAKAIAAIQSQTTHHPSTISMTASASALRNNATCITRMVEEFNKRRQFVLTNLNEIPGVISTEPDGAFYVFADVSAFYGKKAGARAIANSSDMAHYLLEEKLVAAIPGSAFGNDACIRVSYATSMENISKGMQRIKEGLTSLC
ncbi:MAG: aspartate aminotransferase [Candidatus Raymondbacteria bacterium RifOxyB12_full_50_8]|nr:MAG: aspartate aminotransferase [Candidatus Raymondbacteria bacterium RifOxyB12_full_50_8]